VYAIIRSCSFVYFAEIYPRDTINVIIYATFNPARLVSKPKVENADSVDVADQEQVQDTTGPIINSQNPSGSTWAGDFTQSTTDFLFRSKESGELYPSGVSLTDNSHSSGLFHEGTSRYADTNNFGMS